ncbi:MAG: dTDP-4-amino-4,6-dideoxygalactose transaminase [Bacteroidetes bacterium HGW-Bacteroidetes-17]|jgi:dTDP-4-amino-4,6-dideoxygalactose transaminase|nr:MAG: dTDP-4-amino-4,6-dideoxygalactose transaminase [Bacteroidetes bacterium HGW-Bacteroidetes-17]
MNYKIPFNKPHITGKEAHYIYEAVYKNGHISGNGIFTKKCQLFFENKYGFKKTLLTTSCTDAIEMCALLLDIKEGDEIIVPSYTFVSSALAFVRQGAKIIFADSHSNHPNIDENKIEALITPKTKVIVPVHYAGMACDMDKIMAIAKKYQLWVVEDSAQAIDSFYKGKPIGSIGHFGCFSFHETKNIQSGEGGMLAINDEQFIRRAEIIWEKGTNRAEFFRGEVNKYNWVDIGSSFLPSDIIAAFLYAQLENLEIIQKKRKEIWNCYYEGLKQIEESGHIQLPHIPDHATNNGHMFYILLNSLKDRSELISHLKANGILSVFHYLSLHKSPYYNSKYSGPNLEWSDNFENRLLRLPLYYSLTNDELTYIINCIKKFKF